MTKGTLLVASLIALSGSYLAWDFYSESKEKSDLENEKRIVLFPQEQIQKFVITNQGRNLVLERSEMGWDLQEPLIDQADFEEVESYISAAANDRVIAVVDEGDEVSWQRYGLSQPTLSIEFFNNAGSSRKVWVSELTNFEGHSYARIDEEKRVVTVNSSWFSKSQKTALDFRDKRILKRKLAGIDDLLIKNKNGFFNLQNAEGLWSLQQHPSWMIDQERSREVVKQLADSRALDILFESNETLNQSGKEHWKNYGLDRPDAELVATFAGEPWSLRFAQKNKEDFYVWTSEPDRIYRVDLKAFSIFKNLIAADLRDHKLPFKAIEGEIVKINFQTELKQMVFELKEGKWHFEGKSESVNQEVLSAMLQTLKTSQALEYLGDNKRSPLMTNVIQLFGSGDLLLLEVAWQPSSAGQKFKAKSNVFGETFHWASGEIEKLKLSDLLIIDSAKPL